MRYRDVTTAILAGSMLLVGCNRQEPVRETATRDASASIQDRGRDRAELEKRVIDVEQRWTEMQTKVQEKNRTPTAALRAEVKEDVTAVRQAVANLETTTAENWWERHQQATERTVDDIEADVRHFVPKLKAAGNVAPAPVGTSASFEARRDDFVDRVRARVDAWEDQLKAVSADGARKTELDDTRARIDKLQDDLDRLRTVDANDWWNVSQKRVSEYIDRLENSIGRLDNDK
jgi:hypothetical protein